MYKTAEQAWTDVEDALGAAKAITWDTCHKIYILMDDQQVELMRGYGYDPIVTSADATPAVMLTMLKEWYGESCSARFISAVESGETSESDDHFTDLIPQFFSEELV